MKIHDKTVHAAAGLLLLAATATACYGQKADERPKFEVASLKPNNGCQNQRNQDAMPAPGRLQVNCVTLQNLIQVSYGGITAGKINPQQVRIVGGPGWMQSDFYSLAAKGDGPTPVEVMIGPMLQALLEERCQLKVHREMRELPVYALTVGKNGLKIQPAAEGSCTPLDLNHLPAPPAPGAPMPNMCGMQSQRFNQGVISLEIRGVTMKEFAQRVSNQLDRPVIDKTELTGIYDIHLEYSPDSSMRGFGGRGGEPGRGGEGGRGDAVPQATDPAGPTIIAALQEQIGLKLSPEKGPVEHLVIDHIEKPAEN